MSLGAPDQARGAVGRGDLLRALAAAPRDRLVLDVDPSGWFGYLRQPPTAPVPPAIGSAGMEPAQRPAPVSEHRLPLQMRFAWAVAERQRRASPGADQAAEDQRVAGVLTEAQAAPELAIRLVGYEDLVPPARLLPALRRHLGATRAGAIDLAGLTAALAARRLPRRLPRRVLRRWHPDLVVVLDFCPRLWPYREDMHRLAERLLRQCGRSGVSLRIVNHGPLGPWSDWLAHQGTRAEMPPEREWVMPAAGTPVLLASDLGLLRGASSPEARAWATFVDRLKRRQVVPLALAPLGAEQLDAEFARALPVLRWSPDAPVHPDQGHGAARPAPDGLAELLAMVAAARRVDPPLLRAMRRLNPTAPLDAGLEGAVWCHEDVTPGFAASIRSEAAAQHLGSFARLLPRLQARLDALRRAHHAHLSPVLMHEETLLWASHGDPAVTGTSEARAQIEHATEFMRSLAGTLTQPPQPDTAPGDWAAAAQGVLRRVDPAMARRFGAVLIRLAAGVRAVKGDGAVPGWVDPKLMVAAVPDQEVRRVWLVQDAASGSLQLQPTPAGERQLALGGPLMVDGGGLSLHGLSRSRWLSAETLPTTVGPLDEAQSLQIESTGETLTVAAVRRPRGAVGWAAGAGGIVVASPPLAGQAMRWSGDALRVVRRPGDEPDWTFEAETAPHPDAAAMLSFGIDAGFGVHADLSVRTRHGHAVQRLRWIEPGAFLMGSPADEPERHSDEGPQHAVTLTQGFWLADTACTQALWGAVRGRNPSHFKGAERPVEQVSWEDVQAFLRKLEGLVPGSMPDLPTEAEWEYACRAGTTTPYSFGASDRPGACELRRPKETVPVRSLPPNPWGLYEMHGNVWEWCADGMRDYEDRSRGRPVGEGRTHRAIRGGSWNARARGARSAFRGANLPGLALDFLGFRLCLRSSEPGPGRGRPGGPAGRPPGGRAAAPPRDEAEPARESGVFGRLSRRRSPRRK